MNSTLTAILSVGNTQHAHPCVTKKTASPLTWSVLQLQCTLTVAGNETSEDYETHFVYISSACYSSIAIWNLKFARLNRSPLALVGVVMPCLSVSERLTSPQPARSTSQGIPRTRVEARRFLAAFCVSQTTDANATCGCNKAKAEVALRCF